jgi:hypothetical protein
MEYRGFTYEQDIQEEEDNRKIFHEIVNPQGRLVPWGHLPAWWHSISPYRSATQDEFKRAVDEVIFVDFCVENNG